MSSKGVNKTHSFKNYPSFTKGNSSMTHPIKKIDKKRIVKLSNGTFKKISLFSDLNIEIPTKLNLNLVDTNDSSLESATTIGTFFPDQKTTGWCYAASSQKGNFRHTNEDRFNIISPIQLHSFGIMAGIFDGFGSDECSNLLAKQLLQELNKKITKIQKLEEITNQELINIYKRINKLMIASNKTGGSTSLVSIAIPNKIFIWNIGDSFALLISKNGAIILNNFHNAKNPCEKELIINKGGVVFEIGGIARVGGELAVTRAIGNFRLNKIVSSNPEFHSHDVNENDLYLVLGSDGISNFLNENEIFEFFSSNQDLTELELSEGITKLAYQAGSNDNITAIVINLQKLSSSKT